MLSTTHRITPVLGRTAARSFAQLQPSALSLDEEFPGLPQSEPVVLSQNGEVQSTTLPNGVKVVSQDMAGATASISVVVGGGSQHETATTAGASHMMQCMAFKSTTSRSSIRFFRDIEELGGNFVCTASRQNIAYSADVLKQNAAQATSMLADTVCNPAMKHYEVAEAKAVFNTEYAQFLEDPTLILTEALHEKAFTDASPLGQAFYNESTNITDATLNEYAAACYTANNIVVAGAGVAHSELVEAATSTFGGLASSSAASVAASPYVGGELRKKATGDTAFVAVGFKGAGYGEAAYLPTALLEVLLASEGLTPFSVAYKGAGLVGLYGAGNGDAVTQGIAAAMKAAAGSAPAADALAQAKAALKLRVAVDSRNGTAKFLGEDALLNGNSLVDPVLAAIDAVSAADVQAAAKAAVSANPTVCSVGAISTVPHFDAVCNMLK